MDFLFLKNLILDQCIKKFHMIKFMTNIFICFLQVLLIRYIKNNTDNEILKSLKFNKKQTIKYVLRALPNEISGGIATSLIFSAWNAAVYVNQISDEQIMNAERKKYYQKIVKDIVNKNKGLYFNNELFVIEKK